MTKIEIGDELRTLRVDIDETGAAFIEIENYDATAIIALNPADTLKLAKAITKAIAFASLRVSAK